MESEQFSRPNRRLVQSAETRLLIVSTARRLFVDNGYIPTSVGQLAGECGVAVQTIYNSVGSKSEVLSAVIDLAASGDQAPESPLEFLSERLEATTTTDAMALVLSDWFRSVNGRMASIYRVLSDAAAIDPAAAELKVSRDNQRFERYSLAPALIRARGGLSDGTGDDEIAALIWSTGHPQTYDFLLTARGWTPDRYAKWCNATLSRAFA